MKEGRELGVTNGTEEIDVGGDMELVDEFLKVESLRAFTGNGKGEVRVIGFEESDGSKQSGVIFGLN